MVSLISSSSSSSSSRLPDSPCIVLGYRNPEVFCCYCCQEIRIKAPAY
jgi:hypothetical protein